MQNDSKIQDIAVSYMCKHVVGGKNKWPSTAIGALHPSIVNHLSLENGELVILSAFFSSESWYAFTTRRIASQFRGVFQSLDPSRGIRDDFGNFKGYGPGAGAIPREVANITATDSQTVLRFEFETFEASMLPIYAARYWNVKHRVVEKLMTTAEREEYKRKTSQ